MQPFLQVREVVMDLEMQCPECESVLRVAEENLGKRSRCPSCSHVFIADEQAEDQVSESVLEDSDPLVEAGILVDREATGNSPELDFNPYSPISHQDIAPEELGELSPTLVGVNTIMETSWAVFKQHWAMACVSIVIVSGVNYVASFIRNLIIGFMENFPVFDPAVTLTLQLFLYVFFWSISIWLQLGHSFVMLDICRGKPVDLGRIFAAGPRLVSAISAWVIVFCFLGLLAAVFVGIPVGITYALAAEFEALVSVGLVGAALGLIPFVILWLCFSVSQLLVADRNCGPWEAVALSTKVTEGNRLSLLLVWLLLSAVSVIAFVVGILALCVGVIPSMIAAGAFASLVLTVAYLLITGQEVVVPGVNAVRA